MKKQTTNTLLLLTLMSFLFLTSCAVTGNVYEHENIEKLEEGMTEQKVTSILGVKPHIRTNMEDGNRLLTWNYAYGTALATSGVRTVSILFSNDNKMIRVVVSSESGKAL